MAVNKTGMTVEQAMDLRRMAIAKGVSREQVRRGRQILSTAFDALKLPGSRLKLIPPITAPPWGCVYFVDNVLVQLDQPWNEAIDGVGYTPEGYLVRQLGHLYPPTGTGIVYSNLVLVNLNGDHYYDALNWAQKLELPPASPRHVFSLAKAHSDLNTILGTDPCYVVSPEVAFHSGERVCCVLFRGSERRASALSVGQLGNANDWVTFLRV